MFELFLIPVIIFAPVIAYCIYESNKIWKIREEYDRHRVAMYKERWHIG